jgi:hypothetical protein
MAVSELDGLGMSGLCPGATGLEVLLRRRWGADFIQSLALGLFLIAYWWSAYWVMKLWWLYVERRCPVCLSLRGMPDVRGKEDGILIEPLEVESICLHGHGLAVESRWRSRFERVADF